MSGVSSSLPGYDSISIYVLTAIRMVYQPYSRYREILFYSVES